MEIKANGPQTNAPRGVARDIHRIKQGTTATAAELREFISQMKGRGPQEVLGVIAQSSLMQGVVMATILTILGFAVFTVGPYYLYPPVVKAPKAAPPAAAAAQNTEAAATDKPASEQAAGKAADTAATKSGEPELSKKTLERLGVDEVKQSDASSNPLENKGDDLLNDLK